MTRKWTRPLTYAPKIPAVLEGTCTQTIRPKRLIQVGDQIMFHGWEGKPYRSHWSFRTPYWTVRLVWPIIIQVWGIQFPHASYSWGSTELDILAEYDGIVPAYGHELGRILTSMHKIPEDGLPAQIIRWDPGRPV